MFGPISNYRPIQGVPTMADQIQVTHAGTAAAPIDPNISSSHPFNHEISLNFSGNTSFDEDLWKLLGKHLTGVGRVDLVSMALSFKATASGQSLYFGVTATGSTATAESVAHRQGGISYTSNSMNYGVKHYDEIIPESLLSRQLHPVSSFLPMIRIVASFDKAMNIQVILKIKVHDYRIIMVDCRPVRSGN